MLLSWKKSESVPGELSSAYFELSFDDAKRGPVGSRHSIVVRHSQDQPAFFIGVGDEKIEMHHGNFAFEERIHERIALEDFELIEEDKDHVKLRLFSAYGDWLDLDIQERCGRIHIIPKCQTKGSKAWNRFWMRLPASSEEAVFGCGEQFSHLNLRGKKVPLWVSEQGVGRNKQDPITIMADKEYHAGGDWHTTYFPQPTFLTSRWMYGHIHDSLYMEFDFIDPDFHELGVWGMPKELIFSKKADIYALLEDLSDLFGRQPNMPDWAYNGIWLGVQGGTETILDKLEKARERGVHVSALWVQDWSGRRVTTFGKQLMWNWKFEKNFYPDLPKTIADLKKDGIRFLGYINPFLALEGDLYPQASKNGYLIKNTQGEEYHIIVTTFPAAMLDLTNPEACRWIKEVIKTHMIGIGMSGWMCDYGEYLPTDAVLYSGEDAASFHNRYPMEWARLNREAVEESGMDGEILFFTRAGFTGSQRYSPMMWAGDQLVNWSLDDGLASVIPAAISLGLCGHGLSHSDCGGFTSLFDVRRTKELFQRWTEMAAFSPVMRTHESNRPDENWQFDSDEETIAHLSKMVDAHVRLKPYLQSIVGENALKGIPVMRPIWMDDPRPELFDIQYAYLLGPDLLVAPVIVEQCQVLEVTLPKGDWVHIWTGKPYSKGVHSVDVPLGQPAVFWRKDSQYAALFERLRDSSSAI